MQKVSSTKLRRRVFDVALLLHHIVDQSEVSSKQATRESHVVIMHHFDCGFAQLGLSGASTHARGLSAKQVSGSLSAHVCQSLEGVFCGLKSSFACRFSLPVLQRRALSITPCSSLSATSRQYSACSSTAEPQGWTPAKYVFGVLLGKL